MITLRSFKTADAELLVHYLNDKQTTQYITAAIPQPYTKDDASWWIEHANSSSPTDVIIKGIEFNGVMVGCISATAGRFEYNRSAELGYWIGRIPLNKEPLSKESSDKKSLSKEWPNKELWNQGIGTKALSLFVEELNNTTDFARLFVSVVACNGASIRVLEKNGFTFDGLLKQASYKNGEFYDECMMSRIFAK